MRAEKDLIHPYDPSAQPRPEQEETANHPHPSLPPSSVGAWSVECYGIWRPWAGSVASLPQIQCSQASLGR